MSPEVIPYGRQDIASEDIDAVAEVLRSDWLTQGPAVGRFEDAIAAWCGAPFALAMNSATSALHVACLALGLGRGDLAWTVPISFVASANCILYCGAEVDFVDVDPIDGNIDPAALEAKLAEADRAGRLPKVLIPVLFTGRPYDQARIAELCGRYGVRIIEDASHAIGAIGAQGEVVGSCRWADVCVFSFHPVKIVTTGEGGVATARDEALARRMQDLRSHGITKAPDRLEQDDPGGWYYEQHDLGFNYRMTDMQAALGASQMRRLDAFVERRNALVLRYETLLASLPVERPPLVDTPGARSSWHLYPLHTGDLVRRRAFFDKLRARSIGVQVHYIPIHHQPYYRALGFEPGMFPGAERFYAGALSIPLFSAMTEAQQDRVVAAVAEVSREIN